MSKKQKILIGAGAVVLALIIVYFTAGRGILRNKRVQQIKQRESQKTEEALPTGNVSPITGLNCDNWNRRPIAVMQPADVQARPAAGFSEADMVIEMPAYTASNTRLMGVYICNLPKEIAAIRSGRHDNIHIASGLDAIFVHWGYSIFAENLLNKKIVDNVNCLASPYCDRNQELINSGARTEDTGRLTAENAKKMLTENGFRKESKFSGYPHQAELSPESRPNGGHLRVAFAKPYDVEYDYDRETNTYLRTWADKPDTDRNNGQRVAPKNIVVMMAASEQITNTTDYVGRGLQNPWEGVPEVKNTGAESISGRYNNVQLGDPWYDTSDSGEAFYYLNGQQYRGSWKKDRNKIDSKLTFFSEDGSEMKFVP